VTDAKLFAWFHCQFFALILAGVIAYSRKFGWYNKNFLVHQKISVFADSQTRCLELVLSDIKLSFDESVANKRASEFNSKRFSVLSWVCFVIAEGGFLSTDIIDTRQRKNLMLQVSLEFPIPASNIRVHRTNWLRCQSLCEYFQWTKVLLGTPRNAIHISISNVSRKKIWVITAFAQSRKTLPC